MNLKNNKLKFFIDLSIIFLIFFLDRITKIFVINYEKTSYSNDIFSSKFLNIHLIWNQGIAFGLFSFDQKSFYNFLTLIIFFVIIIVLLWTFKSTGLKKYILIMIFAGALGNFFDRIVYGAVPDFIDLHINNFHWFIFNVADIFISLGVIFMILSEFFVNNNKYEKL